MSSKTAFSTGTRKITGFILTTIFFLLLIAATTASTTVFAPAVNYGTGAGTSPVSVATCDFNGDSAPDAATANNGDGSVSILLGNADGTFQAAIKYSLGTGIKPDSIICGDFNADGRWIWPQPIPTTTIFRSCLATATAPSRRRDLCHGGRGTSPISITMGDFDKDGKLDLATANVNSNDVSILLGERRRRLLRLSSTIPLTRASIPIPSPQETSTETETLIWQQRMPAATISPCCLGTGTAPFQAAVTYATGDGVTTGITPSPSSPETLTVTATLIWQAPITATISLCCSATATAPSGPQ